MNEYSFVQCFYYKHIIFYIWWKYELKLAFTARITSSNYFCWVVMRQYSTARENSLPDQINIEMVLWNYYFELQNNYHLCPGDIS